MNEFVSFVQGRSGFVNDAGRVFAERLGPAGMRAEIERMLHDELEHTRVYSLSTSYDSPKMWRSYAAERTGYCLEFANKETFEMTREVHYLESIPLLNVNDNAHVVADWFFFKTKRWAYEREARVVLPRASGLVKFRFGPDVLTRIILGGNVSVSDAKSIRALASRRSPELPVWTARWLARKKRFELVPP